MKLLRPLFAAMLALLSIGAPAQAAGTIPLALTQQQDVNGRALAGCLLYIYQVGTTATPQNAFSDFGLTLTMPNPLQCDQTGRIPMFYLADGQVHVRLTDSGGLVQFDYPTMQVIGPSVGGGGGGGSVDPNSVASTGDMKSRLTGETLTGWIKLNALSIGSATSGATQRANADTQALFIHLWNNCRDVNCPVSGGRGASGLADFSANKQITVPDMRGRTFYGLNDMGAADSGFITPLAFCCGDTGTTIGAAGGSSIFSLTTAQLPAHTHTVSGTSGVQSANHTHGVTGSTANESGTHTHSGTTTTQSANHTHSGTTSTESANHTHSGTTGAESANHTHTVPAYVVSATATAVNAAGLSFVTAIGTSGTNTSSIESVTHAHDVTTGTQSANHTHTVTTGTESANHTHDVTTGAESAVHQHNVSITSGTESANHTHSFSATSSSIGSGDVIHRMSGIKIGTWYMKL